MKNYVPVLIVLLVAVVVAIAILVLSRLAGRNRPTKEKLEPYECGVEPVGTARERQSVKFYLVAMVFLLFDIEAVFLYPWAVVYRQLKLFGFFEMAIFVALVLVGFFYVYKKGALDWSAPTKFPAGHRKGEKK